MSHNLDDEKCVHAELAISAFVRGVLPARERESLFSHVMSCGTCLQALVEGSGGEPRARLDVGTTRYRDPELIDFDPATSRMPRRIRATH